MQISDRQISPDVAAHMYDWLITETAKVVQNHQQMSSLGHPEWQTLIDHATSLPHGPDRMAGLVHLMANQHAMPPEIQAYFQQNLMGRTPQLAQGAPAAPAQY